jgi:hypothetical protein
MDLVAQVHKRRVGGSVFGKKMTPEQHAECVKAKLAERTLLTELGHPGDKPWWFQGVTVKRDPSTKRLYLEVAVHSGLTTDSGHWPYGLSQKVLGFTVKPVWQKASEDKRAWDVRTGFRAP